MRSKLSYYSVALLVGLAVVSALVLTMNPFNGAPASASPAAQTRSATTSSVANASSPLTPNSPAGSPPAIGGSGNGPYPGGDFDGDNNHWDGFPGIGSNTTTTTTATIYSQDE